METNSEKRIYERRYLKAPIMFAQYTDKRYCYYGAFMHNYSMGGIYFESSYPLQQGKLISIKRANCSPASWGKSNYREYRAEVKWCKEIVASDKLLYGTGVKYFEPITEPPVLNGR